MKNIGSIKKTSSIFLAVVLVLGTFAVTFPSFMLGNVQAQQDYGMDSYDKKPYGNSYEQDYGKDKRYDNSYDMKDSYGSYDNKDKRYDNSYDSTKYSDHKKDMKYNDYNSDYGMDKYKKSYDKKDSYGTPNYKDNQDKRYNPY
ncbi:MAG TPA: hypothetical protein VJ697_08710 [Nitrososphaeraceae archaeon]|nr:hypothetical protein [Nitrososphaeraceae archaeon]